MPSASFLYYTGGTVRNADCRAWKETQHTVPSGQLPARKLPPGESWKETQASKDPSLREVPEQIAAPLPHSGRAKGQAYRRAADRDQGLQAQPPPGGFPGVRQRPAPLTARLQVIVAGAERSPDAFDVRACAPQQSSPQHTAPDLPASREPQHRVACRGLFASGDRLGGGTPRWHGRRYRRLRDRILRRPCA